MKVASPDLSAKFEIVVDDPNLDTALCSASGGRDACGASTNHQYIEMALRFPVHFSVSISMPGSHNTWQLRRCGFPLTITRHSKQIPIPHSGPRGSPFTETRHACPAIITAAATVAPEATTTCAPLTVTVTWLGMGKLLRHPRRQVR